LQASDDELLPPLAREHEEAAVHTARDDDAPAQWLADLRGKREPVLVIESVFVFAE
jgi:hypothetical protein